MTSEDIKAVIEKIPQLTDFGIGLYEQGRGLSPDERAEEFRRHQQDLIDSAASCTLVCQWLANLEKTKTINERHSSYGLKHMAARAIGYVTNGVFIAAAVHCGFPYRLHPESPNVCFGISERSIRKRPVEERNAV
jgi:hypothetical protein